VAGGCNQDQYGSPSPRPHTPTRTDTPVVRHDGRHVCVKRVLCTVVQAKGVTGVHHTCTARHSMTQHGSVVQCQKGHLCSSAGQRHHRCTSHLRRHSTAWHDTARHSMTHSTAAQQLDVSSAGMTHCRQCVWAQQLEQHTIRQKATHRALSGRRTSSEVNQWHH
jgi:hypothetical protein